MNKLLLTPLLLITISANAQEAASHKQPATKPVQKVKGPAVKTHLAKFSGSKVTCTAEEGKKVITMPLVVSDDKNNTYTLSSYQFAYKRLGVTENEETGAVTPTSDLLAQRFTETPLPAVWKLNIIEQLQKGEELYFFDVIAKDKQGRLFFAPDLKLTIQ